MINIIEAERLLNEDMADDEVDFLLAAREGIALYDVPDGMMKTLTDHNLIDIIPFDHPRAHNSIKGVVPSEDGVKVLNVLDNRKWADARNPISDTPARSTVMTDAEVKAQSLEKDVASQDGEIPADDARNVDPDTVAAEASEEVSEDNRDGAEKAERIRGKNAKG